MDPTIYVRVQAHRRVSKRGKIERVRQYDRLRPINRPAPHRRL